MADQLTVAFDADDTLWHNEKAFAEAEHYFDEIVAEWADPEEAQRVLVDFERKHVALYGYGVKSFVLSMIGAACDISKNQVSAETIRSLVNLADELLAMPTVLIDGAVEALAAVAASHPTMIITKGDLHHQLRRIHAAGIDHHCFDVEVVADKDEATYRRILARHRIAPEELIMVGNSIVSDVAPLLAIGARAVHIPYEVTWALETATEDPPPSDRWFRLDTIKELPALIEELA